MKFCLDETGENSHVLSVAHAGVATAADARNDKPRCLCGNGSCTNSPNSDKLQADHRCENSICKLRLNVSQLNSGSGQSTSSCGETEVCLDITQENIRLKQEEDTVLNHLLQWKRDDLQPARSTVAPLGRELKAYWHEWDTIELKDDILYKKRFRDVGNDAEYLFLMPAVLRKETFRQLHANITGGHLGRRKTYDKI